MRLQKEIAELSYLTSKIKILTKEKDKLVAKIQGVLQEQLENRNTKFIEYIDPLGRVSLMRKGKVEIDNFKLLKEVVGEDLTTGKFLVKTSEKIEFVDKNFERALITLYRGDYKEHNLLELLSSLGIEDKDIKIILKKLKGEYTKDKELLEKYCVAGDDLEEELDIIYEQKNFELVDRYFNIETIDFEKLKKALNIDDTLAFSSKFINTDEERKVDE